MANRNLGVLLYPLSADVKKKVRQLERSSFKLCKQMCSKLFNHTCLNDNIYIYILA